MKLFHHSYEGPDGKRKFAATWSVRWRANGKKKTLSLRTADKALAQSMAEKILADVKARNADVALARHLAGANGIAFDGVPIPTALSKHAQRLHHFKDPHYPPCVYFLVSGDEVLYVGQTIELPLRIATHRKKGRAFDRVLFLPVPRSRREEYEAAFIKLLRPKMNERMREDDLLEADASLLADL